MFYSKIAIFLFYFLAVVQNSLSAMDRLLALHHDARYGEQDRIERLTIQLHQHIINMNYMMCELRLKNGASPDKPIRRPNEVQAISALERTCKLHEEAIRSKLDESRIDAFKNIILLLLEHNAQVASSAEATVCEILTTPLHLHIIAIDTMMCDSALRDGACPTLPIAFPGEAKKISALERACALYKEAAKLKSDEQKSTNFKDIIFTLLTYGATVTPATQELVSCLLTNDLDRHIVLPRVSDNLDQYTKLPQVLDDCDCLRLANYVKKNEEYITKEDSNTLSYAASRAQTILTTLIAQYSEPSQHADARNIVKSCLKRSRSKAFKFIYNCILRDENELDEENSLQSIKRQKGFIEERDVTVASRCNLREQVYNGEVDEDDALQKALQESREMAQQAALAILNTTHTQTSLEDSNLESADPEQEELKELQDLVYKQKKDISYASSSSQRTRLHHAALCNYPQVIRFLVEHGANINALDDQQETSLRVAIGYGHLQAVETLLDLGASVAKKDGDLAELYRSFHPSNLQIAQLITQKLASAFLQNH